jgi:hypothetical protein
MTLVERVARAIMEIKPPFQPSPAHLAMARAAIAAMRESIGEAKMSTDEIARLRELLRPFARAAAALRPDAPDSEPVVILAGEVILTAGDFRAARRAIDN